MNILMLTPYLPYPLVSGGQIRTYNLLKNLSRRHAITLFALIKNSADRRYIKHLSSFCRAVRVFQRSATPFTLKNVLRTGFSTYPFVVMRNLVPETATAVQQELSHNTYDLIHAETFYMMPNLPQTNIPVILVEQTIEYLGYQSYADNSRRWYVKPLLKIDILKIKHWEQYYWQACQRLITMSEADRDFIHHVSPQVQQIDVVANGVDTDFFDAIPKKLPPDPTILFVGTFSWLPNRQAVIWLVEHIWPLIKQQLPAAKLKIVGFSPTEKIKSYNHLPDVTVDGGVKDIRTAYSSSHVLVAPVNWGKGTRYKILEAMATKTPVICTPLAVEGIKEVQDGVHVLLGEATQQIVNLTVQALTSSHLRQKLAANSYALVTKYYNWPVISHDLDQIYQEIGGHK